MRALLLFMVSLLHLPSVVVMVGWYSRIPSGALTVGLFVGPYLQLFAFVIALAAVTVSARLRRDVPLIVISIVGVVAFWHHLTHSPY